MAQKQQGTVSGWPEEICAKLIKQGTDLYVAPLTSDGLYGRIDRADLSVLLRISQLYELMNRFTLSQRPRVVIIGTSMTEPATKVVNQISLKFVCCV